MLFEHTPHVPAEVDAGLQPEVNLTSLTLEERAALLRGLHEVDAGRAVDELAADLIGTWDSLTPGERTASLGLIGALIAATVTPGLS